MHVTVSRVAAVRRTWLVMSEYRSPGVRRYNPRTRRRQRHLRGKRRKDRKRNPQQSGGNSVNVLGGG